MTRAPGTKKNRAAMTHRLIEEVPLWLAAAIQRGPRTVAMLKSRHIPEAHRFSQLRFGVGRCGRRKGHRTPGVCDKTRFVSHTIIEGSRSRVTNEDGVLLLALWSCKDETLTDFVARAGG